MGTGDLVSNEWVPPSQRTGSKRKTQSPHGPTLSQVRVSPTAPRCVSFDAPLRYTCAAPLAAEESADRAEGHANESPQSENQVIPGGTSGMNRTLSFAATEESLFANSGISTADFEFLKVVGDGYYGKVRSRSTLPRRSLLDGTNLRLVTTLRYRQVFAVRHRDSREIYAMKAIKKDRVVQVPRDVRFLCVPHPLQLMERGCPGRARKRSWRRRSATSCRS